MMEMYAGDNCWNADAAGGACIGCGCCSEDPIERYEARIDVLEERIFNLEKDMHGPHKEFNFESDAWVSSYYDYSDPEEKIEHWKEQISYYRGRLREIRREMRDNERAPA